MASLQTVRREALRQLGRYSTMTFSRGFAATVPDSIDLSAPVSLQKARTWDEGVSSKFATSSLEDLLKGKKVVIFGLPGAYTGVCSAQHVPSYTRRAEELKKKGVDSIICVSVNDPYTMNAWAERLGVKDKIEFYGDFNGAFHKLLGLSVDLSGALLGERATRWSAYIVDGKVKASHVEESPAEFKVSDADTLLASMRTLA